MNIKLIIGILMCFCCFVSAQINDALDIQRSDNGTIRFARFSTARQNSSTVQNDTAFLNSVLKVTANDKFVQVSESTDELGYKHKKYQQYYKSIKVENAQYVTHSIDGRIEVVNGDFQNLPFISTVSSLSEQQALNNALHYVNAKKYRWEDEPCENYYKEKTKNPNATYYPKGELVIAMDYFHTGNNFKLAWKFSILSLVPVNNQLIYVDAGNGSIINIVPQIYNDNVPLFAETIFSGIQAINGCISPYYNDAYQLQETRNGVSVITMNINNNHLVSYSTPIASYSTNFTSNGYSCPDLTWGNFTYIQPGLDAHWGAEKTLDFWKTKFNRNSIDGKGMAVESYIHYNPDPTLQYPNGFHNAAWCGAPDNFMGYGDGDGLNTRAFASLDICAHELGHGVCQSSANLLYKKESGAINESLSDIWAACVENYVNLTQGLVKDIWLIGEEIYLTPDRTAMRSMKNPKSESQPDTYGGIFWINTNGCIPIPNNDQCGVHTNSGVMNYWFYLLSVGGAGTNDIGSNYNVTAIGIEKAQKIVYRAETVGYITELTDFTAVRDATIYASTDLYGLCSPETQSVINAWYAVGVGSAFNLNCNVDLYIKDNPADIGVVQLPTYYSFGSPDIWVEKDGQKVGNLQSNTEYDICVRIRNRDNVPSNGYEKVYLNWSLNINALNDNWREGWENYTVYCSTPGENMIAGDVVNPNGTFIGQSILPESDPNSTPYVFKYRWTTPDKSELFDCIKNGPLGNLFNHNIVYNFSFLARVDDGTNIPELNHIGVPLSDFVHNNNNVAVNKRIYLSALEAAVVVADFSYVMSDLSIEFADGSSNFTDYAELYVKLDDDLQKQWEKNGSQGEGFTVTDKGFLVTSPHGAVIKNLKKSNTQSINGYCTFVNFLARKIPEDANFEYNITQLSGNKIINSVPFVAVRDMNRYFSVQAYADAQLVENVLPLSATEINENADYVWYNQSGVEIGTGSNIETELPTTSQWYKLEVTAEEDNYKDYDSVFVKIPTGQIISLTPNPTADEVTVDYFLSEIVDNATLQVSNTTGTIVIQKNLNITEKQVKISFVGLVNGNYSIVLLTNGSPADSKQLLKQ